MPFNVHVPNVTQLTSEQREQLDQLGEFRLGISWYGARPSAIVSDIEAEDAADAARQVAAILRVRQNTLTVERSRD